LVFGVDRRMFQGKVVHMSKTIDLGLRPRNLSVDLVGMARTSGDKIH